MAWKMKSFVSKWDYLWALFCTDTLEGSKFAQEKIENLSINGLKRLFILVLLFVPFLRGKKILSVNPLLRKS
jgi:hypothetical protein